jgi:hypothetical protein
MSKNTKTHGLGRKPVSPKNHSMETHKKMRPSSPSHAAAPTAAPAAHNGDTSVSEPLGGACEAAEAVVSEIDARKEARRANAHIPDEEERRRKSRPRPKKGDKPNKKVPIAPVGEQVSEEAGPDAVMSGPPEEHVEFFFRDGKSAWRRLASIIFMAH